MSQKVKAIKGMEDLWEDTKVTQWQHIEHLAAKIFSKAGFQEIRTPIVEEAALFERSVGETTEIVEKEMYTLFDRKKKRLALRPEGTASVVRAFVEHLTSHQTNEARFFYFGPMFRYERPQKGRYRQFHQFGAEIFGTDHPLIDAELIALAYQFFQELKLEGLEIQLNSLGTPACRKQYLIALKEYYTQFIHELCQDCQKRLERNPLRLLDCKQEACQKISLKAPEIDAYLSEESQSHFKQVQTGLKALNVPFNINHRMVRGLDYYEKTVFEVISSNLGAQNSVAGGGRYNDLVQDLGGPSVPAIGFAIGLERLVDVVDWDQIALSKPIRISLIGLDEKSSYQLFEQLPRLQRLELQVQPDWKSGSLKSKMRRAARWNADWVVLMGEAERNKQIVIIRDMKQSSQEEVALSQMIEFLKAKRSK